MDSPIFPQYPGRFEGNALELFVGTHGATWEFIRRALVMTARDQLL
jgi:hypothetical protein